MRTVGVIPARYKSSRFPGKPLIRLNGIPMIIRVAQIVEKALGKENTYVATDDIQIKNLVESYGFNIVMTSENCLTGTDRVFEFSNKIDADIYVNIQGDEPLLDYNEIIKVVKVKEKNYDYVVNGMCGFTEDENPNNINIPKVIVNKKNELIYMSRLPIPGSKTVDLAEKKDFKKQVCIYAFNKKELEAFGTQTKKSEIEKHEDIEILRFFDLNIPVLMVETDESSLAVDVIEDVAKVEEVLQKIENS
ncbi:3-deoxy-manno-octulosonate cytidylyltransferase [Polaribacter sp. Hel1_85]|uniref:3-deoxy-manno-octulosonate cytidylyltransferase n=1 Tax=Polaribacter sp. Hel1_85 TaxID=1250005 RepID=UPI00052C42B9|nr:3-deoxy-manno-octulosonate cytidylyltransferase [Polaribacter sp. Hel1_85]KGL64361.1 3-deoxy-manno-octulosonate cytidylyltransferase [Polaribacter sp. Hel1_85]